MDKGATMPARKNQENLLTDQPQKMNEREDVVKRLLNEIRNPREDYTFA